MVELPFAPFFLCKLTSSGRGWIDTHHLGSLDPELYHHLMWLKNYQGDFEELGLDFTTLSNEFGQSRVSPMTCTCICVNCKWEVVRRGGGKRNGPLTREIHVDHCETAIMNGSIFCRWSYTTP